MIPTVANFHPLELTLWRAEIRYNHTENQGTIAMIQRRRHSQNLCYPAVSRSGPCP